MSVETKELIKSESKCKPKKCKGDCDPRVIGRDDINNRAIVYCFGACGGRKIS